MEDEIANAETQHPISSWRFQLDGFFISLTSISVKICSGDLTGYGTYIYVCSSRKPLTSMTLFILVANCNLSSFMFKMGFADRQKLGGAASCCNWNGEVGWSVGCVDLLRRWKVERNNGHDDDLWPNIVVLRNWEVTCRHSYRLFCFNWKLAIQLGDW